MSSPRVHALATIEINNTIRTPTINKAPLVLTFATNAAPQKTSSHGSHTATSLASAQESSSKFVISA